ncbi:MAG: hypothetical protein Kow00114_36750 [Kiloniellaceae bacterium]
MPAVQGGGIVIKNEEDAWAVLKRALAGEFDNFETVDLRFEGWPRLKIKLDIEGPIIRPSLMRGIVELQQSVYRSYAIAKYGEPAINRLTKDEKAALEFDVKVSEGSSISEIVGEEAFQEFLTALADKMTPEHIVITLLGGALILAGQSVWKQYLQGRTEERREEASNKKQRDMLEHLQFAQRQETERMKILARAMQASPSLNQIDEEAEESKRDILKSIPEEATAHIAGAELNGEVARELIKNPRRPSEEITFQGDYTILRVDTTAPDGFRVRLQRLGEEETLTAGVRERLLSEAHRQIIREAEWAKAPIRVTISAKRRGDDIVEATIREVERLDV